MGYRGPEHVSRRSVDRHPDRRPSNQQAYEGGPNSRQQLGSGKHPAHGTGQRCDSGNPQTRKNLRAGKNVELWFATHASDRIGPKNDREVLQPPVLTVRSAHGPLPACATRRSRTSLAPKDYRAVAPSPSSDSSRPPASIM